MDDWQRGCMRVLKLEIDLTKNLPCRYVEIPGLRQIDSEIRYYFLKENRFLLRAPYVIHPLPCPVSGSDKGVI